MNKVKLLLSLLFVIASGVVVLGSFNTESVVSVENNVPIAYIYERLVPNPNYTEWCNMISNRMANDTFCITPRGSMTEFSTDEIGTAMISIEADAVLFHNEITYFEVAIAPHGNKSPTWFLLSPTRNHLFSDDQATLKLTFEGLVPDADYSLWCVAITHSPKFEIHEQSCS